MNHSFVLYDCCSDLKAARIRRRAFLLPGLLLSVLAFQVVKFSVGIPVNFQIAFWIKFCGYSWEYKTFWSSSKRFFLTSWFSTMVQIFLASVKGIFFLHCLGWQELHGTHLGVSVFFIECVYPNVIVFRIFVYHDISKW